MLAPVQEQINELRQDAVAVSRRTLMLRDDAELAAAQVAWYWNRSWRCSANASPNDTGNITAARRLCRRRREGDGMGYNGVFTLRDYDPRTGLLRSIQTGGATLALAATPPTSRTSATTTIANHNVEEPLGLTSSPQRRSRLRQPRPPGPREAASLHPSVGAPNQTLAWATTRWAILPPYAINGVRQDYGYVQGDAHRQRRRLPPFAEHCRQPAGSLVHDANGSSCSQSGNCSFGQRRQLCR